MRKRLLLLVVCAAALAAPLHALAQEEDGLPHPSETPIAQGYVGDAWADEESPLKLGVFSFRILLQTRYAETIATRRARRGMIGDRVDVDARYGARSFWAVWGLVAYRFKVGPIGIMPAGRVEWLDADREHDVGGRLELSAALNILYKKSLRGVLGITRCDVQSQTAVLEQPQPLPYQPYFALDYTRMTLQVQLEI